MYLLRSLPSSKLLQQIQKDRSLVVHLWKVSDINVRDQEMIEVLSESDLEKLTKISDLKRRKVFLQTRFIFSRWVQVILESQVDRKGSHLGIKSDYFKLPDLDIGTHGKYAWPKSSELKFNWQFNWSHSGEWCALALHFESPLGVDIEEINEPELSDKWNDLRLQRLSNRLMTESEKQNCQTLTARQIVGLMTKKESLIKAEGKSLIVHAKQTNVGQLWNSDKFTCYHVVQDSIVLSAAVLKVPSC